MAFNNRSTEPSRAPAGPWTRWACGLLVTAALFGGQLVPATAQQPAPPETGTLQGQVVNAATGEPVIDSDVAVVGTARATLTGRTGNFRLANLRPGTYRLQVRSLGFRTLTREFTITPGDTTRLEVRLPVAVIPLHEVVVTGQPGALARREIGTSVATIAADQVAEERLVQSVSQLMQARAPGVSVQSLGGLPGQGSRILMRGVGTLTQQVQPVIYVDGIRIDNSPATGIPLGGIAWTGLEDINPEDIDRIEIVRGASAAALYGTEAAGGVVQIFTKQGRGGSMSFNFRSEMGVSSTDRDWWAVAPEGDWFFDNLARSGRLHRQHVAVRGAGDRFSYYASATVRGEEGVVQGSGQDQNAFRANMRVSPAQNLAITLNTAFSERTLDIPYGGNSFFGLGLNTLLGGEDGLGIPTEQLLQLETQLTGTRFTGGISFDATLRPNFTHRLTLGSDIFHADNTLWHPYGTMTDPGDTDLEGMRTSHRREARTVNADYVGRLGYDVAPDVRGTTSFGFQAYRSDEAYNHAEGYRFVGPGLITVGTAAGTWGDEDRLTQKSAGGFLDQQFGLRDVLFANVSLRLDGHSAFGPDHRYQLYHKAGVSYVASEHGILPEILSTARLRAAYGTAGNQPGNFVYMRSWVPVPAQGASGLTTGNIGNPDLRPEVSREVELGFDVGVLEDRLALEFTVYNQRTSDALFPIRYPPSAGFILPQLENVGTVENQGIELALLARVLETAGFRWDARANLHTNRNRAVSIGADEDVQVAGSQWIREGHPVAAFFDAEGELIGPAFPTRSVQLGSTFGIGQVADLHVLFDHRGGHYLESQTQVAIQGITEQPGWEPAQGQFVHSAEFWRLREAGVSFGLPAAILGRTPFTSAALSITGRNLWRQHDYPGLDPEAHFDAFNLLGNQTLFDVPIPRQVTAGISVYF